MAEVVSTAQFKNGMAIEIDGENFTIVEFQHVKPGKGGAFVRTRVRNIATGAVLDKTFRSGEKFDRVHTQSRDHDLPVLDRRRGRAHGPGDLRAGHGEPRDGARRPSTWVVENQEVQLLSLNGEPASVEAPNHVELAITHTEPGLRGDTAQGGTKPATLETGVIIQVPLFIEEGERVRVDTRTGGYITRV